VNQRPGQEPEARHSSDAVQFEDQRLATGGISEDLAVSTAAVTAQHQLKIGPP